VLIHRVPAGPTWTLGKEVDAALLEWYTARGQPVPPDEVGIGAIIDAANAAEDALFLAAAAAAEEVLLEAVNEGGCKGLVVNDDVERESILEIWCPVHDGVMHA
jgi:hypothetical protein